MAKSNKAVFWSLFAAGGTLAALLAPVLALLFLLLALGRAPAILSYANLHAFAASWLGMVSIFGVITLFLWHAAHRLRVTLHDLGVRLDGVVALLVYGMAAAGTLACAIQLWRI
ncbi:MAG: fumarate reductase subunit FrdD [Pseudomonadota bacterium]